MIAYPEDFDHASSLAGMFLHFHFGGFSNKFRMRAQVAYVIASSEEVKVVELMRIILLQCLFGMQKVACFRELLLFLCVREKSLGYAGATPASVVPDVLRVLARNTQVFLFPLGKEKASFRWPYLFGAQKRTLAALVINRLGAFAAILTHYLSVLKESIHLLTSSRFHRQ